MKAHFQTGGVSSANNDDDSNPGANIFAAIQGACKKIAPLWPLKSFVAVNPFLGFSDKPFHEACASFRRINRVDILMPRGFYKAALKTGFIERRDVEAAISSAPNNYAGPRSFEHLESCLRDSATDHTQPRAVVATVSEVLDKLARGNRHSSLTAFMIDEISKFCASYYDDGQAILPFPLRDKPLYLAWLDSQEFDRNPQFMGLKHFRSTIARMSKNPVEAISYVVQELGIPDRAIEDYLYRALFDVNGWASYIRHIVWKSELSGEADDSLIQLLAIRVVWGYGLFLERTDIAFREAWKSAMAEATKLPRDYDLKDDADLVLNLVLHDAYERAHQRLLLDSLSREPAIESPSHQIQRPSVQAAFCIDVRSEIFRRAFELSCPGAETIGFAGFFGIPFEFMPIGDQRGSDRGPVLLKPGFRVMEGPEDTNKTKREALVASLQLKAQTTSVVKIFKHSAISCFAYVEAVGFFSLISLIRNTLRLRKRPGKEKLAPSIKSQVISDKGYGFTFAQRLQIAKSVLKSMSLTTNFAPVVLFVGHGSETVNNPHASGLNCGACGGHSGEVNARVAAKILNDPSLRMNLRAEGIAIPEDTWFFGGLHNTTTDEISIFETETAPASVQREIKELSARLLQASQLARAERSPLLGIQNQNKSHSEVFHRTSDWSQVRPEWGLAGNVAFLVGPRRLTLNSKLKGQTFLQTYNWKLDKDFGVLESIMTAPMIVASWINLQYFASTTNNAIFGAGNKVLHNVSGTLGVIEGNSGDLKVGLPWQSIHDGTSFIHKPLRLNVVIAAPISAINDVIKKHSNVRDLVNNNWIHLFAQADDGQVTHKYSGNLTWI